MSTRKKEEKDPLIYRIVVAVLGLTVIVCVIGTIVLTMTGFATPELLVALGSAAIGGLAGYWPPHQQTISSATRPGEGVRSPCPR